MLDGILLIDKPPGPTSHDLVNSVRRLFGQRRVGHAGTLDPAATGLLVMLLGKATRLAQWMVGADKEYEGAIRFGVATETLDSEGTETARRQCRFTDADLQRAVAGMIGEIVQIPPKYSALKIDGKPAYKLARMGLEPDLKSRRVTINNFSVDLVESGDFPLARFVLTCSTGTYVRSVAADLGAALGCPAHLADLRRTKVGAFDVKDAITKEGLEDASPDARAGFLLPLSDGVDLPSVTVGPGDVPVLLTGRAVPCTARESDVAEGATVKIFVPDERGFAGLGKIIGEQVKPFMILRSEADNS